MRRFQLPESTFIKRFLLSFLVFVALLVGINALLHQLGTSYLRSSFKTEEAHNVQMRKDAITSRFKAIVSDLLYLADQNELRSTLEAGDARHRASLARELVSFSNQMKIYDQITVLDETGTEVVQVDLEDGTAVPVPERKLQYEGDRYYFNAAFALNRGQVYVSPFDLNVEEGRAELPSNPVIRFGTPIFDSTGRKRGIVLVNLLGDDLIRQFNHIRANPQARLMLLNRDGFWLSGGSTKDEWGATSNGVGGRTIGDVFPDAWRSISAAESGQFQGAGGLFSFTTVCPLEEIPGVAPDPNEATNASGTHKKPSYCWEIVSFVPKSAYDTISSTGLEKLLPVNAVILLLLGGLSWRLARAGANRETTHAALKERGNVLHQALNRYVPNEVSMRVLDNPARYLHPGGKTRLVTVLFADIRGFTHFSEGHSAEVVVELLNRVFSALSEAVFRHHGVVDKFMGDALMAFFEERPDEDVAALRAAQAAVEMQASFTRIQAESDRPGVPDIGLGIGINTGEGVVGNVGSEKIMDYTVIGDVVNVAARLQGSAGRGEIIMSESTYLNVQRHVVARKLPPRHLRGKARPIVVYRLERVKTSQD